MTINIEPIVYSWLLYLSVLEYLFTGITIHYVLLCIMVDFCMYVSCCVWLVTKSKCSPRRRSSPQFKLYFPSKLFQVTSIQCLLFKMTYHNFNQTIIDPSAGFCYGQVRENPSTRLERAPLSEQR